MAGVVVRKLRENFDLHSVVDPDFPIPKPLSKILPKAESSNTRRADGTRYFAYSIDGPESPSSTPRIWVYEKKTGRVNDVSGLPRMGVFDLSWSPDGGTLAVELSRWNEPNHELSSILGFVTPARSGWRFVETARTPKRGRWPGAIGPKWSSEGYIELDWEYREQGTLFTCFDPTGKRSPYLITISAAPPQNVRISPSGEDVAFDVMPHIHPPGGGIFLLNLKTKHILHLTYEDAGGPYHELIAFPRNNRIEFARQGPNGRWDLYYTEF